MHELSFRHCTSEFASPPPFVVSPKPVAIAEGSVVSSPCSSCDLHAPFAAPALKQPAPLAVPQKHGVPLPPAAHFDEMTHESVFKQSVDLAVPAPAPAVALPVSVSHLGGRQPFVCAHERQAAPFVERMLSVVRPVLVSGAFVSATFVSGTFVSGTFVSGTLVSGTFVSGTLASTTPFVHVTVAVAESEHEPFDTVTVNVDVPGAVHMKLVLAAVGAENEPPPLTVQA